MVSISLSLLFLSGIGGSLLSIPLGNADHTDCTDFDTDRGLQIDYPQDPGCTGAVVALTLTDGQTDVVPGSPVNYVITLAQNRAPFVEVPVQFVLPSGVDFLGASENGMFRDGTVSWNGVTAFQGRPHRLTVFGNVRPFLPAGTELLARVTSGRASSADFTHVRGLPVPGETGRFSLVLSDGLREVKPADTIRYRLNVRRGHYSPETADIVFQLPPFTTLFNASVGASVDLGTVTWPQISFAPWQTRVFAVTVLVDRSVPEGYALRARAHVGPVRTHDETVAVLRAPGVSPLIPHRKNNPVALGGTLVAMNTNVSSYRAQKEAAPRGIFQVRTDATEVVPGGMLRLSALLRNPFPHTLSGLSVSARLSPETAQVARLSTGGAEVRSGRILWQIPDLPPGGSWAGRVALRLPENLPHGTDFRAVFSLEGPEAVRVLPLTERVASVHSTLLAALPKTGVPFDVLFASASFLFALLPLAFHRRLIMA